MPTKKVATKAAPKVTKTPAKKVTKKASSKVKAKPELAYAPSEQCFWTTDGRVLSSLVDLKEALASMSDDVFAYHVSKGRNDFAEWIQHVLGDAELAETFRKSKKLNTAHDVVVTRLRIYSI
ncbi:hypothetical protein IPH92_00420 [Candidatus Kaiserbacteria bacterium]|nr:MAG: hypothetical protein IPH92_00420 [Candidatus Kaiserbacteria bacterium]